MNLFVTVLHVLVCVFLIVVVLLQRGKGAEVGAMFGGGGAGTMFGARGAGNLLTRLTTISATIFMLTSLYLAILGQDNSSDLFDEPVPAGSGFEEAAPESSPFESVPDAGTSGFEEVTTEAAEAAAAVGDAIDEAATGAADAIDEAAEAVTDAAGDAAGAAIEALPEDAPKPQQ